MFEQSPIQAGLSWYLRLRWIALVGHVVALSGTWFLGFHLDLVPVGVIVGLELMLAIALIPAAPQDHPKRDAWLVGLMTIDAIILTALLYLTGGPHNPLSVVVMINVALAAVLLPSRAAWFVTAATIGMTALLFVDSRPLRPRPISPEAGEECACCETPALAEGLVPETAEPAVEEADEHDGHGMSMELHMRGMWAGYGVAGAVIVWFLARLRRQLAESAEALRKSEEAATRAQQQSRLATLAAGAAHELATPLNSIAIAAGELVLSLPKDSDDYQDAMVVRDQVRRCREVLNKMSLDVGSPAAGARSETSVANLLDRVLSDLDTSRVSIDMDRETASSCVLFHGEGLVRGLKNLVDNGLKATRGGGGVTIRVRGIDSELQIDITDDGIGMSSDVIERVGQPFFTTRETGEGMGLGVFVARSVAEQMGGTFQIRSQIGDGTTVSITIPRIS